MLMHRRARMSSKRNLLLLFAVAFLISCGGSAPGSVAAEKEKSAQKEKPAEKGKEASRSFDAEKAKAMANPYANDYGPAEIDKEMLATYPKPLQDAYKNVLQVKCIKCHTASRPLNSQFFEIAGKKEEKKALLAKLKSSDPDMFKDKNIWQVETNIWQRYVKRMMAKPGCEISKAEGKQVWKFLVYDSNKRKAGKNKGKWKVHRTKLLTEFKEKHPDRHKELYEKK